MFWEREKQDEKLAIRIKENKKEGTDNGAGSGEKVETKVWMTKDEGKRKALWEERAHIFEQISLIFLYRCVYT